MEVSIVFHSYISQVPICILRRHVFRDLRPYICTFSDCLAPNKQYLTRHDWFYHGQQMHRWQWVCSKECQSTFPTKGLMMEHLRLDHSNSVSSEQFSTMVAICERPIDDNEILACPLCPNKLNLGRLKNYIAEYLKSIALFVLPAGIDGEDVNSRDAAATDSSDKHGGTDTISTLSSLGFSQHEENTQSPHEFLHFTRTKEIQPQEKCETWLSEEAAPITEPAMIAEVGQKLPKLYDKSKIFDLEDEARKLREMINQKEAAKRGRLNASSL